MSERILSIDIFRGLTIFTMVFVNDVAGVRGIPGWMRHVPADADAMTFVDVVFPAFLFIVGMSVPLALRRRLARGDDAWAIGRHIFLRTLALVVLGVFMVNAEEMNREANLLPPPVWNVLLYLSAILIWNVYPVAGGKRQWLNRGLQAGGVLLLVVLWWTFRKGEAGALTGMTPSWWGILGLIGWAYLLGTLTYVVFRDHQAAMAGMMGLFLFVVLGLKSESLMLPDGLGWLRGQSGHFAHAALVLGGILLTLILTETGEISPRRRIIRMLVLALLLALAAYFVRPFFGISKIFATPGWVLYCAAICCSLFPLVYWLADIRGIRRWANFLHPAGSNPLLTYILPFIFYAVFGFSYLPDFLSEGIPGIIRSVVFTLLILEVSAILTRWNIRLQL